jgi:hypothetical protein
MSNLVKFAGNAPTVSNLAQVLRSVKTDTAPIGMAIIKMDKTGHWVVGADQTEIEKGSVWAVNPLSFVHGFIAWGQGEVLAEKMYPIDVDLDSIDLGPAPSGAQRGWENQLGMAVKCVQGSDEGLDARFSTTSVGGKRALIALMNEVADQDDKDHANNVALVELGSEYYAHKVYGRVYTPVFKTIDWVSLDYNGASEAKAEPASTGRRRRS